MKIEGAVVLYNPNNNVIDNIKSYLKPLNKLYVIDNSEIPNNNEEMFKDPKIKYVSNGGNKGIANALNVACKMAIEDKADWVLTMDQDSSFKNGAFEKMITFLEELKRNKIMQETLGTSIDNLAVLSALQRTGMNIDDKLEGIDFPLVVMTSGNLINMDIYQKIGGFKDWLFIDAVDFEYCLNAKKHRYKVIQMNTVELNHNLGKIEKKKFLNKKTYITNHNAIRRYYITRNRHYLYDMYKKDFDEYCRLEVRMTKKELIKILLFEKDKLNKIRHIYKGYRDYKKGKKGAINE